MQTLFEYGNSIPVTDRKGLEIHLCSLWGDYKALWPDKLYNPQHSNSLSYQPFLSFDGDMATANNFVGFIHYENVGIEIYPKVFQNLKAVSRGLMHQHLFYWFSYCEKIKFPFNRSFLDNFEIDQFPELIVYLIARQINEAVNQQPYSSYEEVEEVLATPRGRINFNRYTNQLSYGRYHLIDCDHQPFVFDNILNRVIKYCTRLLLTKTRLPETQKILNETIFLLDEVEDHACTVQQLDRIRITALFQTYEEVIHTCRMILENQIYSHAAYEIRNWSLLFPMEYIFEDFVAGFFERHFSDRWDVHYQKSNKYLVTYPEDVFQLQHDIFLTSRDGSNRQIIIDTKYKLRTYGQGDPKKGVSQNDLYQVVSYAFRRGCSDVILIYPNVSEDIRAIHDFFVPSGFDNETIRIRIVEIPFWSMTHFSSLTESLKATFTTLLD